MGKVTQITVRLDADLERRADALAAKLGPVTSRVAILREAMRAGLQVLEEQYRALPDVESRPAPRRSKR